MERVKRWISVFYANIETAVLNNGFATKWFKPSRGVRQGCPLPSYLYVHSAANFSCYNSSKQSYERNLFIWKRSWISQFADDTNLLCTDISSVENAFVTINNFGDISGLQLNVKKTTDSSIVRKVVQESLHTVAVKPGGLNFLLRCNYDPRYLHPKLPIFIEIYCRSSSKYNVNLTLFRLGFFGQSVTGGAP